jgi:WD40 repeat protein
MGVVWLGRQRSLSRRVALKVVKQRLSADSAQQAAFLDEAILTAQLEHPNIVPIHDLACDQSGRLFYVMKEIQGQPWSSTFRQDPQRDLEILMSVADAIAFAHSRGIVHRDLKPDNVMVGQYGEVQVVDWGLAFPLDIFPEKASLSSIPNRGCTPVYAAPELVAGGRREIGPWSDIYLLGAILFHLETGTPPHTGRDVSSCCLAAQRNEIVPTDREGELLEIARKAMATLPAERYATVPEFQEAIRQYREHQESLRMSALAQAALDRARETGRYDDYDRALFGFDQALALWPGNTTARQQLSDTRLDYASAALRSEDLNRGLGLLQPGEPTHQSLRSQLLAAQQHRDRRGRRERTLKRSLFWLGACTVMVSLAAAVFSFYEQKKAQTAKSASLDAKQQAETKSREAEKSKILAEFSALVANQAQQLADIAKCQAQKSQILAEFSAAVANRAKLDADTERDRAEYHAYVASIGKAQAAIDLGDFYSATAAFRETTPPGSSPAPTGLPAAPPLPEGADSPGVVRRGWEWERLNYLLRHAREQLVPNLAEEPIPAGAFAQHPHSGALLWSENIPEGGLYWLLPPADLPGTSEPQPLTPLRVLSAASPITCIRIAPQGDWLAIGTESGQVRLWHAPTLDSQPPAGPGFTLEFRPGVPIRDLAFLSHPSHPGQRVLLAAQDRTVSAWVQSPATDPATAAWEPLPALPESFFKVQALAVTPGKNLVIRAGDSGKAELFELRSPEARLQNSRGTPWSWQPVLRPGQRLALFSTAGNLPIIACVASPDGRLVATASQDSQVQIWNPDGVDETQNPGAMAPGTPPVSTFSTQQPVVSLSFSADAQTLVATLADSSIQIWDARESAWRLRKVLRGHRSPAIYAGFQHGSSKVIISAARDGRVLRWNLDDYSEVTTTSLSSAGPENSESIELARNLSPENRLLSDLFGLALAPSGEFLVVASRGRSARLWPVNSAGQLQVGSPPVLLEEPVPQNLTQVEWFPSGPHADLVATCDMRGEISLWNSRRAVRIGRIPAPTASPSSQRASASLAGQENLFAISSDGRRLAVLREGDGLVVHQVADLLGPADHPAADPATAGSLSLKGLEVPLSWIGFAPGPEGTLEAVDQRGQLWSWSRRSATPQIHPVPVHTEQTLSTTAVSRTEQHLAVARSDGRILRYPLGATGSPDVVETGADAVQFLVSSPARFWCVVRNSDDPANRDTPRGQVLLELQEWSWSGTTPLRRMPLDALVRPFPDSAVGRPAATGGSPQLFAFRVVEREGRPVAVAVLVAGKESLIREADLSQPLPLVWRESVSAPFRGAGPASTSRQSTCQDLACSPDGLNAVTIGGRQACLWNLRGNDSPWTATVPLGPHSVVSAVGIAPDSRHLVTASWDQSLGFWKLEHEAGRQGSTRIRKLCRVWIPEGGAIGQLAFFPGPVERSHPQRFWFATGHQDGLVRVWSWNPDEDPRPQLREGWVPPPASGPNAPVEALAIDAHSGLLAFTRRSELWTWRFLRDARGELIAQTCERVPELDRSPDSPLRSAGSGSLVRKTCLSFSTDGTLLAVGGDDSRIRLLRTASWEPLLREPLAGHSLPVRGLTFSAAGDRLVSVSDDGTARVWNIELPDSEIITSRELLTLRFATSRDPTSGSAPGGTGASQPAGSGADSPVRTPQPPRLGRPRGVLFLPGDAGLVAVGTSGSDAEQQLIVWPARD